MIPYSRQNINKKDILEVNKVLKSNFLTQGDKVTKFEKLVSNFTKAKYSVAVNSASSALHIGCLALGIKKQDIVWTVPNTFVASANCAIHCGAIIDFVDIDPDNWNISLIELEKKLKIAKRKNKLPKLVIPVHFAGLPTDQEKIWKLSKKYKFKILEDASHSIGAKFKGNYTGSCKWSDITVFSFHPVKIITTGEGGMVVTNNINLAERAKSLRNLCFQPEKRFVHNEIGWNYRMTNLQAALGLAQLERLDESVEKKISIGKAYYERLKDIDLIQLPLEKLDYAQNIFWVYGIVLDKRVGNAKYLMKKLADNSIGSRPFFYPIHKQPVFLKNGLFVNDSHPNAEHISEYGFYLPSGLSITVNEIDIVADTLKRLIKEKIN